MLSNTTYYVVNRANYTTYVHGSVRIHTHSPSHVQSDQTNAYTVHEQATPIYVYCTLKCIQLLDHVLLSFCDSPHLNELNCGSMKVWDNRDNAGSGYV